MRVKMLQFAVDIGNRRMPFGEAGLHEAQECLRWAARDHFTLFGYREYVVKKKGKEEILCAIEDSGLGLLRSKDVGKPRLLKSLAAHYMPQSGEIGRASCRESCCAWFLNVRRVNSWLFQ